MSKQETQRTTGADNSPRAIIHEKILDEAESRPDAPMEEIAEAVTGASTELVERVFDEYGDPGAEDDTSPEVNQDNEVQEDSLGKKDAPQPNPEELSVGQREALHAILRAPDATQKELAEDLDIGRAAFNKRVNSIKGFNWSGREEFACQVLEPVSTDAPGAPTKLTARVDSLADEVKALNRNLSNQAAPSRSRSWDPELAHKVAHACIKSEHITKTEELSVLENIMYSQCRGQHQV